MTSPFFPVIPKRSLNCTAHQEVLKPGTDYFSVIAENDEGVIVRKDFCPACWEASAKQECLAQTKSYWKSRVPAKIEVAPVSLNKEVAAFDLLRNALASNSDEDQAEAFILSLYLARKKILYMRQQMQQADGHVMTLFEVAATEEMIGVRKLPLSQLEVVNLQQRIAKKLKGK